MSIVLRSFILLGAGLVLLLASIHAYAAPPACAPNRCHCISTHNATQVGFGGAKGNIAIEIRAIDPRVTGITVSNAYNGSVFFSGMPFVGQRIGVDAKMAKIATAPGVGLMCGVHYWIIDYRGRPHR